MTDRLIALALAVQVATCTPFTDTVTAGTPNLVEVAPGLWRMGQPPTAAAWAALPAVVHPAAAGVVVVKLDDEREGTDDPAESLGWTVIRVPLPPEDDRPWTILERPSPKEVRHAVATVVAAHAAGRTVLWHCVHGRDRTGLVAALVGRQLLGWTKRQAWRDMLTHGFRWELVGLDDYWAADVPAVPAPAAPSGP